MKTKLRIVIIGAACTAAIGQPATAQEQFRDRLVTTVTRADAPDAQSPFERGLLEEEAHHKLDAAISSYQEAVAYFVTNRQMLATAVFRLAECYRKQGKENEARMQYRRILRDFPDQTD